VGHPPGARQRPGRHDHPPGLLRLPGHDHDRPGQPDGRGRPSAIWQGRGDRRHQGLRRPRDPLNLRQENLRHRLNGEPTGSGSGGNDVWISFAEEPNDSILPPSSEFIPDDNKGRYDAWSAALNASHEWIRATAYPHPQYDDAAFFEHDLGVLRLSEPVNLPEYGQLPTLGLLDELYREDKQQPYTAVGYGLEGSGPKTSFGGDTRRRADLRLVNLTGVGGIGDGISAKFSSNANTGGTCFGDSGGPIFVSGTTTLVAVVSFGTSSTCSGTSGAYRIDQADDLAFLATFGITPP